MLLSNFAKDTNNQGNTPGNPEMDEVRSKAETHVQNLDYSKFSDDELRQELLGRGLASTGNRQELTARMQNAVREAWVKFYECQMKSPGRKKNKRKLTDEERVISEQARMAARNAKQQKKLEGKRQYEENMERHRKNKELKLARQKDAAARREAAKKRKQDLQVTEMLIKFDPKILSSSLMEQLDPEGTKIGHIMYDFGKKGFRVRYKSEELVKEAVGESSIKIPKEVTVPATCQLFPAPVESKCVFFLYPFSGLHPQKKLAEEFIANSADNGRELVEQRDDMEIMKLWSAEALNFENNYGSIVNIYRERGFMVLHFSEEKDAAKFHEDFSKEGAVWNGIPFVALNRGTPTKRDRTMIDRKLRFTKRRN